MKLSCSRTAISRTWLSSSVVSASVIEYTSRATDGRKFPL